MERVSKSGQPKLVPRCTYPVTGPGCARRVYADRAALEITAAGVVVRARRVRGLRCAAGLERQSPPGVTHRANSPRVQPSRRICAAGWTAHVVRLLSHGSSHQPAIFGDHFVKTLPSAGSRIRRRQDIYPAMIVVGMASVALCGWLMTLGLAVLERRVMPWKLR